jgi:hypothetical protein
MEPITINKNLFSNTEGTSVYKGTAQSEDVLKIAGVEDEVLGNRLEALKKDALGGKKDSTTEEMIQKWDSSDSRLKSLTNFDGFNKSSIEVFKKTLSDVDSNYIQL